MATKKCMKCGGSMNKYAKGGQALNKAKGFAKAQSGGSNVSNQIYGVPNAGPTGPNRQGIDTMKKGGATKTKKALPKAQKGLDLNWANARPDKKIGALEPTGAKIGVGGVLLGAAGMGVKAIADKVKKIRAKKAEEEKKKKETKKAKFGSSVPVQHSPAPGRVRSSSGIGTVPVGARKQLGGPSGFTSPGTLIMEADKKARSKYYTEDNIRKSGSKLSDKEAEKNIQANKTKLYNQYMKDAKLSPSKKSKAKKSSTKKG